ncbi:MAG: hypothetical protein J0G29_07215, partial [Alphaproteobacteria bacterium]|nr:hypothetical protein [Alphaproteobacteria bacterium]
AYSSKPLSLFDATTQSHNEIEEKWIELWLEEKFPECIISDSTVRKVARNLSPSPIEKRYAFLSQLSGFEHAQELISTLYLVERHTKKTGVVDFKTANKIELKHALLTHSLTALLSASEPLNILSILRAFAQSTLVKALSELAQKGWGFESILQLAKAQNTDTNVVFEQVLKIIQDYALTDQMKNRSGETILRILKTYKPEQWVAEVNRLALANTFSSEVTEKTKEEIFQSILQLNPNNLSVQDLVNSGRIDKMLGEIAQAEDQPSSLLKDHGPISSWMPDTIQTWKAQVVGKPLGERMAEALAVIKRAMHLALGKTPYPVQIISALMLNFSGNGRLAEIATGQGKSLIVAAFAAIKALEGHKVDIITSSSELAERDAHEISGFYRVLGFSCDHNTRENTSKDPSELQQFIQNKKAIYQKDIVYGTVLKFAADIIQDEQHSSGYRGDRGFSVIVVDEVDNMLIDESSNIVRLSSNDPSYEFLEPYFIAMWHQLQFINQQFERLDGELHWRMPSTEENKEEGAFVKVDNPYQFFIDQLISYGNKIFEENQISIPRHLKPFVKQQIPHWAQSAISAYNREENKDYVIYNNKGRITIVPNDRQNTGVTQVSTSWQNGLHQFILIKHGLRLSPESLAKSFMSNMALFKRYTGRIYGMTGTLGGPAEQQFLSSIYGVDFVTMPTLTQKQYRELPPLLVPDHIWLPSIVASAQHETSKGRSVLVICDSIDSAEKVVSKAFLEAGFPPQKIKLYTRSESNDKSAVANKIKPGEIILATNLAGRGTNVLTTKEVEANGGLHVCVTFLPSNLRVQRQAFGRTARLKNRGTAQMIIPNQYGVSSIEELLQIRDQNEAIRLKKDRAFRVEQVAFKDELYQEYIQHFKKLKSIKQNKFDESGNYLCLPRDLSCFASETELNQLNEDWGLWLHEQEDIMEQNAPDNASDEELAQVAAKNQEVRAQIRAKLEDFKKKTEEKYLSGTIIQNPSYLLKIADMNQDESAVNKAIETAGIYAAPAHLLRAKLYAGHSHEAKQTILDDLVKAEALIAGEIIPSLERDLLLLGMQNVMVNQQDIAQQKQLQINVFKKHLEQIHKNIDVITTSSAEMHIRVSGGQSIASLIKADDPSFDAQKWKDELDELSRMKLDEAYTLEAFIPEPKNDGNWFGSIFSMVIGVAQIFMGVAVAAITGPFAASFGVGMIIEGVSDIFTSVKSFVTGKAIEFKNFLQEKGISYAVNLISSGITSAFSTASKGATATKSATKAAEKGSQSILEKGTSTFFREEVKNQFIVQGTAKLIGVTADAITGKVLRDRQEDFEGGVRERVVHMLAMVKSDLEKILVFDSFAGRPAIQSKLSQLAQEIMARYAGRFHSPAKSIAKGVASRIHPIGAVLSTGVSVGEGLVKVNEATDDFCSEFASGVRAIAAQVGTSRELFHNQLVSKGFPEADAATIMLKLEAAGIITPSALNGNQCGQIPAIDFEFHEANEGHIVTLCNALSKAMGQDHGPSVTHWQDSLTNLLTKRIIQMVRHEVVGPITGLGSSLLAHEIYEKLELASRASKEAVLKAGRATAAGSGVGESVLREKPVSDDEGAEG